MFDDDCAVVSSTTDSTDDEDDDDSNDDDDVPVEEGALVSIFITVELSIDDDPGSTSGASSSVTS
jgi:hypothetical protein